MFEVDVNGLTQQYRSKPIMNADITGSSGSIPKPLTYDYMPEGYPKKDGWSVEWDGNIDGKINVTGTPLYKFSDRVLSYEEFLSAKYVIYEGEEQYSGMVLEAEPKQTQLADAVSRFDCLHGGVQVVVVSEDNAGTDGVIFPTKGLYAFYSEHNPLFKLTKETITPMSTDFIPKNFNVVFKVFKQESGSPQANCNVTYNELRDWVERGIPVFAVFIYGTDSQYSICNITKTSLLTNMLGFAYYDHYNGTFMTKSFVYKSDGTIETQKS